MRVIAIDPGIQRTGYAIVDVDGHAMHAVEYGCITTPSNTPLTDRLAELRRDLSALLTRHQPAAAAVERLIFVHNATSAVAVGQARGVVLLTLGEHGLSISEYSPSEVKQAVTRDGRADKTTVGRAVQLVFNLPTVPTPDDAADALALAVCHAGQVQ
jgi:crossover junction endodeoxyribonuclease RuvC